MTSYAISAALGCMMPSPRSFFIYAVGAFSGYLLTRLSNYVRARLQALSTFLWPTPPNVQERTYVKMPEPERLVAKIDLLKKDYILSDEAESNFYPHENLSAPDLYTMPLSEEPKHSPISSEKTQEEEQVREEDANAAFNELFYAIEAESEIALADFYAEK